MDIAEKVNKKKQDDTTLQLIFDYVVKQKYPENTSRNQKANIRKQSKLYAAKSGQLYYKHSSGRKQDSGRVLSERGTGLEMCWCLHTIRLCRSFAEAQLLTVRPSKGGGSFETGGGHLNLGSDDPGGGYVEWEGGGVT